MRVVLAPLAIGALVAACGNSAPSTPPPFASGPEPPGVHTGVGLGAGSGGTQADSGAACNAVEQQGNPIDIVAFANPAAPPTGGTIVPGTYVLTAVVEYVDGVEPGTGLGTAPAKTLVVTADSFQEVESDASGDRRENDTVVVSGVDLTRTPTCVAPGESGALTPTTWSYNVTTAGTEQELQLVTPADATTNVTYYTFTLQ